MPRTDKSGSLSRGGRAGLLPYHPDVPESWTLGIPRTAQQGFDLATVQLLNARLSLSAGVISGGDVTDGGSNTVDVTAGTGYFRQSNSVLADAVKLPWSATTGLSVPSDTTKHVGVLYNSGAPVVEVHDTEDWDGQTGFPLASIVNEAGSIHVASHANLAGDVPRRLADYLENVYHVQPAGGLLLGEIGTRNVTVTEGLLYNKLTSFEIAEINTSVSGSFDRYYQDGAGGWTKEASEAQWPNTDYDDGSGTLAAMTNNWHAALWFYIETDGELVMLYGQAQYATAAMADTDPVPGTVPDRLSEHGTLIGRIIYQESAATAEAIESVFATVFQSAIVTVPGGSDKQVQYNNAGLFGGIINVTTNGTHIALGTPISGVLTNCTGLPVAGMANGTDGELITWDTAGVVTVIPAGTDLSHLRAKGAGAVPVWEAVDISARAELTGDIALATATWTVIDWDVQIYDTDSIWEGVTNPERFTIATDGKYLVSLSFLNTSILANQQYGFRILKNVGAATVFRHFFSGEHYGSIAAVIDLNSGDYIWLEVFASTSGRSFRDNEAVFMALQLMART